MSMQKKIISAGLFTTSLFCGAATVYAATIGGMLTGVLYGGPNQSQAVCYLFNAGDVPVTITKSFVPEYGTAPNIIYDSCGTLVAAGKVCAFAAIIPAIGGNACKVTTPALTPTLTGSLEIRDVNQWILNNVRLNNVPTVTNTTTVLPGF